MWKLLLLISVFVLDHEIEVDVTYYKIEGKTATGELTTEISEPFVAVSRDLLEEYPLNSYLLLYHCDWEGVYIVKDKMGKRHHKSVDVFTQTPHAKTQKCKCKKVD